MVSDEGVGGDARRVWSTSLRETGDPRAVLKDETEPNILDNREDDALRIERAGDVTSVVLSAGVTQGDSLNTDPAVFALRRSRRSVTALLPLALPSVRG